MYVSPDYHIPLQEWNHDRDLIHLLFKVHPNTEVSKFLNAYKSVSSKMDQEGAPLLRKSLWQSHFWSGSYCLLTTGGVSIDVIRAYIEAQGDFK